jgi:glutathione peroxidase
MSLWLHAAICGIAAVGSEFHDRGLMIIGVPSNDLAERNPARRRHRRDGARSIWSYLSDRCQACGEGASAHPFYKCAAHIRPKDLPRWNFHKYLIHRDGNIAVVFPETVDPTDRHLKTSIARAPAAA